MNYALIFAGGTGQRMNTKSLPKQFLKVHGKEIIIHTIEKFDICDEIDGIVVVCLEKYIDFLKELIDKNKITKVLSIVPGGSCGQDSIFNGLNELSKFTNKIDDIVLIHDGVRPIIDNEVITDNIKCVKKHKTAITVAKAFETILMVNEKKNVNDVVDRTLCFYGRAPQSFYFKDIYSCHLKAREMNKHDFIDSAMMMQYFGYKMHVVYGSINNIKITSPMDYYFFKAYLDSKEDEQIKVL